MSSLRTQGPITAGARCRASCGPSSINTSIRGDGSRLALSLGRDDGDSRSTFQTAKSHPSLRAKRSNPSYRAKKEWIASSLSLPCANALGLSQAMTSRYTCAFSRRESARAVRESFTPRRTRAQGTPGAQPAPAVSRAKWKKHTSVVTAVAAGTPGIPCAMVLTAYFALSLVTGLSCHHRRPRCEASSPTWHQRRDARTTRLRRPLE